MTAIRDRQSDPDADDVPVAWDERPLVGARRGLPWWAAVLVGFGLAILGAFVDVMINKDLGLLFKACYALGAVAAVAAVQRRGLFGPMVQPPLVLAVTVPGVILLTSDGSKGTDLMTKAFDIGTPLINGFPTMAITTGVTLAIGLFRIYRERDPDAPVKVKGKANKASNAKSERRDEAKPAASRPAAAAGRGRPAGRTGQTPPPPSRRGAPRGDAPRRRPAEDEGRPRRDAEPGTRKPPPASRQPRRPRPEDGEPRRRDPRGESAPGAPRRRPPRADDPRRGQQPPRRPWDDER